VEAAVMTDSELLYEIGVDLFPIAIEVGGMHCPRCGSDAVEVRDASYKTGVRSAMAGETWNVEVMECGACGLVEEL
jgi:ribosomal protein S27AE